MASHGPISSQYAAAAAVPLIKAPSLWLPKPVEMPMDIHPLPDDLGAYFVYPFTLEQHILAQQPPLHDKIQTLRAKQAALLQARIEESERRRKEALNKLAPGYNPSSFLVPDSRNSQAPAVAAPSDAQADSSIAPPPKSTAEEDFASLRL